MMMKILFKFLSILLLISFTTNSPAQEKNICRPGLTDSIAFEDNLSGEYYTTVIYNGSPFFNKNWENGEVLLNNNHRVTQKLLNYNIVNGHLFWLRNSDYQQIKVHSESIKEFTIYPQGDNQKLIFRKIKIRPIYLLDTVNVFLQILVEGEFNLYAYRKAEVISPTKDVVSKTEYYYQYQNKSLRYFISRRWVLYSLVGDKKDLMKSIVRKNHLKIRKEEGLIKAITLFNDALNAKAPQP